MQSFGGLPGRQTRVLVRYRLCAVSFHTLYAHTVQFTFATVDVVRPWPLPDLELCLERGRVGGSEMDPRPGAKFDIGSRLGLADREIRGKPPIIQGPPPPPDWGPLVPSRPAV